MISKVTSISLEHTLELEKKDTVVGDFIVSGSYKMTEASQIDEEFSYKIPIEIAIDKKYDTNNISLEIDDFVYEVVDEEKLLLKIDLCIDGLELKEIEQKIEEVEEDIISSYDEDEEFDNALKEIEEELVRNDNNEEDLFKDTSKEEKLEIPINIDSITSNQNEDVNQESLPNVPNYNSNNTNDSNNNVTSIFSVFKDADETFSTYSIYILREGDNLDTIINKYKTTRDALSEYNDLSDIRIGSKIIIPSSNVNG